MNEAKKIAWGFLLSALLILSAAVFTGCSESGLVLDKTGRVHVSKNMEWWQQGRFGMFIHWGPVSLKGTEIGWSRGTQVPREEYDNLYKRFDPQEFDAAEWVSTAKEAGMKYIVLTSKHHDGFCLWDTKQTDYNIMNTPFGRDVIKELSQECEKQGIVFCTYYSILDWYHPDYNTAGTYGGPGFELGEGQEPDMARYLEYMNNHLRELIDNYGPLGIMWFDGEWEKPWTYEYGNDLYNYVKGLQPDIIINNRVGKMRQGMAGTTKQDAGNPGDYDTPEQTIGAFQIERPWETCMTICRQWAWKPDDNMKSLKECIQTMVRVAGGDGNFLFNVGPMPDGRIEPRQVERLKEMGDWLRENGESIYGTRGGPFKPGLWGASTCKGSRIYLHILSWPCSTLSLPGIDEKILSVSVLTGGQVTVAQSTETITVSMDKEYRDEIDTVVVLELSGSAEEIKPLDIPSYSLAYDKDVKASNVFENKPEFGPDKAVDDNNATRWATDQGTSQAQLEVDLGEEKSITQAVIKEAYAGRVKRFKLERFINGEWESFYQGKGIGKNAEFEFEPVSAQKVRLNILEATEGPTIWEFQLFESGCDN